MADYQLIWGWQPALYLFLGGLGAGVFVMATILAFKEKGRCSKIVSLCMWSALVCLGVGLLLLVLELTNPLRGLLLWQSFSNFSSWMTFGAWIVLAAMIAFFVAAIASTNATAALAGKAWAGFEQRRSVICRGAGIVGSILAVGVAVYTGVLLMSAPGVPLWNTPLLPALFTVSAFDTGVAFVELVVMGMSKREGISKETHRFLNRAVLVLVAAECVVLIAFLGASVVGSGAPFADAAVDSALLLVAGGLAPWFWGLLVVCGLVLPFAVAVYNLTREKSNVLVAAVGAMGALAGGCALRFIVLMAGLHADYIGAAVTNVFADTALRLMM